MGSSWAFKITASMIKPTREALLDYVSYMLVILSIIAVARVIIGSSDLHEDCINSGLFALESNYSLDSARKSLTVSTKSSYAEIEIPVNVLVTEGNSKFNQITKSVFRCTKFFQSYFAYILAVESVILLLVGILWVKMPKIQSLVLEFSNLLHQSYNCKCFKNMSEFIDCGSSMNDFDFDEYLETIFQAKTNYGDKAIARDLFEKIQRFSYDHEHSQSLSSLYIRKSVIQFIFWCTAVFMNVILFVKLEFYVECTTQFCSHDTFLRIIWLLGVLLLLIYGMFNCATLKWIRGNFSPKRKCFMHFLICGCCSQMNYSVHYQCPSPSVGGRMICNDMALLLHLASSSNHAALPYFTLFLHQGWTTVFNPSQNTSVESYALLGQQSYFQS